MRRTTVLWACIALALATGKAGFAISSVSVTPAFFNPTIGQEAVLSVVVEEDGMLSVECSALDFLDS